MNRKDDEIIARYTSGKDAVTVRDIAQTFGGIVRVENDEFVFANGARMGVRPKSLIERWKGEDEVRAALQNNA
jgi:predicted RNA-binding protein with TRAM domain